MKNIFLKMLSLTAVISIFVWADAYTDTQPAVGDSAPTFKLQDQNGDWHTLGDYKGKYVVLFFYPKDGTPGCTTEACNFRDNIFAFDDLNTQILGISLDDVDSHKEFSEKYSLPYPILADVEKESAVDYGVLGKFMMMTITKRESFIIDPDGLIVKHYKNVDPDKHTDEVIEELKSLQKKA
ncbi:peroxiredoxin [Gammaproteobacteria bacterium]|nr:peroxiredoxin [Gammaproteobacteria bacterium]MDC3240268.1 peroxiredoxin [Gammaproteobacteria bacterium]